MCNVFIANSSIKKLSKELIETIQSDNEEIIENIYFNNAYNNSKTSYILKNGMPLSFVKKVVR